jgi:hypothetical protein
MKQQIKIGVCVAYDWYLLEHMLPLVYEHADLICLSIDSNRISWSQQSYSWDEKGFRDLIDKIDIQKKIKCFEANFHNPDFTPGQNEVDQRRRIAEYMQPGGWHIQLDCDEYFLDFKGFVRYLRSLPISSSQGVNVCCPLVTLFKKIEGGYLWIQPDRRDHVEFIQIASTQPTYDNGRRNGLFNLYTNFTVLHQSWARSSQEIVDKINNWGHKNDFDTKAYFERWNGLTGNNFREMKNFHPMVPEVWSSLAFAPGDTIADIIQNPPAIDLRWSAIDFVMKNNRTLSRIKGLWHRLTR